MRSGRVPPRSALDWFSTRAVKDRAITVSGRTALVSFYICIYLCVNSSAFFGGFAWAEAVIENTAMAIIIALLMDRLLRENRRSRTPRFRMYLIVFVSPSFEGTIGLQPRGSGSCRR